MSHGWLRIRRAAALATLCGQLACASASEVPHLAPVRPLTPTPDAAFRARMPALVQSAPAQPRSVQRHVLGNGMSVFVLERHELPIVSVRYVSRAAGELGPDQGLAALTAHALRAGGTLYENGNEVRDVRINAVPASVTVERTHAALGFRVGSAALEQAIRILSRMVRQPTFSELSASRAQVNLAGPPSRLGAAVDRVVYRLLFGSTHPAASSARTWFRQVDKFDSARIRTFHEQRYRPESSALVVVGDADTAEVVRAAGQWFGDWRGRVSTPPPPSAAAELRPVPRGAYLLRYPADTPLVLLAQRSVPFGHADYWPLELLAHALTGTFSSRAQMSLRHTTGLSYFVKAETQASAVDGVFLAFAAVDKPDVAEAVRKLEFELDQLSQRPVEGEELAQSKLALLRVLRGELGTNAQLAERLAISFAFGDPIEVLAAASARVSSATPADLVRVARSYLGPDRRVVLVVGNLLAKDSQLSSLGALMEPPAD